MIRKTTLPFTFLVPTMAVLAVLALVPTIYAVNIALENRTLGALDAHYVWLQNFIDLWSDRRFLNAIKVSLTWELITVVGTMAVSILIGTLMFVALAPRYRAVFSLIFLIPLLMPRVSAAFVWRFSIHPLIGVFAYPYRVLTGQPLDLLAKPVAALLTVAMVDIWQWSLFFSVIILKLLESLPKQPLEAARLDHARTWQIYAYIALPMLKVPLISLMFIKMIESLRSFDLIYVMTRGGPGIATETLDMYAFSQGFIESGRISYASAMAVLLMIATSIAVSFMWKRIR